MDSRMKQQEPVGEPEPLPEGSPILDAVADWRILAVAPSALLLQTTHRVIGAGVGEHSIYATDPVLRFRRSYWQTLGVAFYDAEYGRQVRALHKPISGTDPRGRRYHAWDGKAYFFVVATVMWAVEVVAERFDRQPLTDTQRSAIYQDLKQMARLAGTPASAIPATLAEYDEYFADTLAGLENHPTAHTYLSVITTELPAPAGMWRILRPSWAVLVRPAIPTMGSPDRAARHRRGGGGG